MAGSGGPINVHTQTISGCANPSMTSVRSALRLSPTHARTAVQWARCDCVALTSDLAGVHGSAVSRRFCWRMPDVRHRADLAMQFVDAPHVARKTLLRTSEPCQTTTYGLRDRYRITPIAPNREDRRNGFSVSPISELSQDAMMHVIELPPLPAARPLSHGRTGKDWRDVLTKRRTPPHATAVLAESRRVARLAAVIRAQHVDAARNRRAFDRLALAVIVAHDQLRTARREPFPGDRVAWRRLG